MHLGTTKRTLPFDNAIQKQGQGRHVKSATTRKYFFVRFNTKTQTKTFSFRQPFFRIDLIFCTLMFSSMAIMQLLMFKR